MKFDVRVMGDDVSIFNGNGHVDLFERSNPVVFACANVFDWSGHSGLGREEVESGILSAVGFWYEAYF